MNDRALRNIVVGLGGRTGVPRQDGFVITAASEIMAIFCLANGTADLKERIDRIIIGYTRSGEPIRAEALESGAMAALLQRRGKPQFSPDSRRNTGAHSRWTFRQYRTRLQLPDGDPGWSFAR